MIVLMNGYGLMSFAAGQMAVRQHGRKNVVSLFCDTKYEDADTYRWGRAACDALGILRIEIADGRNPWQVFRDRRYLGNTRVDPCSEVLKRELARSWMDRNALGATVCVGIHAEEAHRMPAIRGNWSPFSVVAPLCESVLGLKEIEGLATRAGLWKQQLYKDGFPHANCGGRCVKQGQGGWIRLLLARKESYLEAEREEEGMRQYLGKDVAILRDRRGGTTKPLTLKALRERHEAGQTVDRWDVGGCGCFTDSEESCES